MLFFGKKKKKNFVVKKRTEDDTPFIIPHISLSEDLDEKKNQFVSPMHGTNNEDKLYYRQSNRDVSVYDAFRATPLNRDDEYKEFAKVPSKKPVQETPVQEEPKDTDINVQKEDVSLNNPDNKVEDLFTENDQVVDNKNSVSI